MNIHPAQEVDRCISYYEKEGERFFVGEILLEKVKLADLIKIIPEEEYEDDFLLLNSYYLDYTRLLFLAKLLQKEITFNLEKYDYFLESHSI